MASLTVLLAHGIGADALPVSRPLLAYLMAAVVVLAALTFRLQAPTTTARATTPGDTAAPDGARPSPARRGGIGPLVGLVGLVLTFAMAAASADGQGFLAPIVLITLFWMGGQALAVLAGDWFARVDPFLALATLVPDDDPDDDSTIDAPTWTAAAGIAAFVWFWFAYATRTPSNGEVATFLGLYTVAVVAGAVRWGRGWVAHGEGFGATFGLLAGLRHPRRLAAAEPARGTAALVVVYLGGIAFDGVSQTTWWLDVRGTSAGWSLRAIDTVGLVWITAMVALALGVLTRVVEAIGSDGRRATADETPAYETPAYERAALALLPLGVAGWILHELPSFLVDVQNAVALASDPIGRGWDLFGTIDLAVDYQVLQPSQLGWLQIALLASGAIVSAAIAHEHAFARFTPRTALRVAYPAAAVLAVITIGASFLLVGT